ncbi:MAG: hypothetical protein ACRC11_11320 [Xenococcaceae cyanobacterium]
MPEIYQQWRTLVSNYDVKGVNVHDARLVATCHQCGLTHILTNANRKRRQVTSSERDLQRSRF